RQMFHLKAFVVLDDRGNVTGSSADRDVPMLSVTKDIQDAIRNHEEAFVDADSYWIDVRKGVGPQRNETHAAVFPKPTRITELNTKIAAEWQHYVSLAQNRVAYRDTYVIILLLMTVLVLFAAVWVGLFLSRRITVPIEALSEATREISAG